MAITVYLLVLALNAVHCVLAQFVPQHVDTYRRVLADLRVSLRQSVRTYFSIINSAIAIYLAPLTPLYTLAIRSMERIILSRDAGHLWGFEPLVD